MAEDFDFASAAQPEFQRSWEAGKSGLASLGADAARSRALEGQRLTGGLSTLQNWDANHQNIALMQGAAGMLAPTKTGSFSESFGNALSQGASGLKWQQQQEMDRFEKMQRLQAAQSALVMRNSTDKIDAANKGFSFMGDAQKAYEPIEGAGYDKWRLQNRVGSALPGDPEAALETPEAPAVAAATPDPNAAPPIATADATPAPAPSAAAMPTPPQQTAAAEPDPDLPSERAIPVEQRLGPQIPPMPPSLQSIAGVNPQVQQDWETLHLYRQFPEKFRSGRAKADLVGAADRMKAITAAMLAKDKKQSPREMGEAELMKGRAKQFNDLAETAGDNATQMSRVQQLEEHLSKLNSGVGGTIQGWAAKFGLGEHANDAQAAEALLNQLVPAQRQGMPGAASDRDVAMFRGSLPALSQTKEGRQTILNTMKSVGEYNRRRAEIASKVQSGDMDMNEATRELRRMQTEENPFQIFQQMQQESRDRAGKEKENDKKTGKERAKSNRPDREAKSGDGEAPEGTVISSADGKSHMIKRNGKWEKY